MKRGILLFFIIISNILLANEFKVVGYLPHYRFEIIDNIDFTKITHLNLAFLNPDSAGSLSVGGWDIDPVVAHARADNPELKIFASIGGGVVGDEMAYDKFLLPENRSEFAHLLVDYVNQHNLDGIDVDLEWDMVNEYYSPFVLVLADSLKSHGKQISAALPGAFRYADLSQEAMSMYDFINLMVYDKTGPWRPNDPGPHSPREFAAQSIAYWRNQGLEDSKMTLGVPFYGYDFTNQSSVTAFTFGSLVSENNHYAYSDQVGQMYYNGIPTIQYKTLFAMDEEIAGVMIWELGQDAFGSNSEWSLLSAIDYVVKTGDVEITGFDDQLAFDDRQKINIFPNPFHNELTVAAIAESTISEIKIFDLQGREQFRKGYSAGSFKETLGLTQLPGGMYVLKIQINGNQLTEKVFKAN